MSVEAVAQTEGASQVEVRPRVGGIILKKMFDEGAPVKAGQVMFQLDPAPFQIALTQAKAAAAGQGARITQTSRESSRLKDLLATQSISQREYDNATSDVSISQAGMMQAQANIKEAELNLSYTRVTAPVSGVAGRFQYSEGALVLVDSTHLAQLQGRGAPENWPIWFRLAYGATTSAVEKQELNAINSTGEAVLALPSFTQKPVIILSALEPMQAKSALADDANQKRQDFMRLYPNAKQVWVDSGRGIPLDKPESVIAAIREVMAKISLINSKDSQWN